MYKNRISLIGFIGQDPESKVTPTGKTVTRFSLATKDTWKDAQGQRKEETTWHTIIVWGKKAEFVAKYLKSGSHVEVEGPYKSREYTDQAGTKRTIWEVKATEVLKLDRMTQEEKPGEEDEETTDIPF